jgi:hypothetical protein
MSSRLPTLPQSSDQSVSGLTTTRTVTGTSEEQPSNTADGVSQAGVSSSEISKHSTQKSRNRVNKPRKLKYEPVIKACERCRGRQQRCDGETPCERCKKAKLSKQCTYRPDPALPPACERCRRQKERCSRIKPCSRCRLAGVTCQDA